jgi:hypothetical protein
LFLSFYSLYLVYFICLFSLLSLCHIFYLLTNMKPCAWRRGNETLFYFPGLLEEQERRWIFPNFPRVRYKASSHPCGNFFSLTTILCTWNPNVISGPKKSRVPTAGKWEQPTCSNRASEMSRTCLQHVLPCWDLGTRMRSEVATKPRKPMGLAS